MAGGKRNVSDRTQQGLEPSRKKVAVEADDEPVPEPTTPQRLATLELKLQALSEENERLKERVVMLEMRCGDQENAPPLEELEDAKAQPKAKVQPKAKAQPKKKATKAKVVATRTTRRTKV